MVVKLDLAIMGYDTAEAITESNKQAMILKTLNLN